MITASLGGSFIGAFGLTMIIGLQFDLDMIIGFVIVFSTVIGLGLTIDISGFLISTGFSTGFSAFILFSLSSLSFFLF
jgi:hypothetical protein